MKRQKVFVYEYATCGGLWHDVEQITALEATLMREGGAMVRALIHDCRQLEFVDVMTMHDTRFGQRADVDVTSHAVHELAAHDRFFAELAHAADWSIIIAPETAGILTRLARRVLEVGGRLASPDPDFVALGSDKCRTTECWRRAGLPVPRTIRLGDGAGESDRHDLYAFVQNATTGCEAILKPNDGAGSWQMRRGEARELLKLTSRDAAWCLQEYCPGSPASVAAIGVSSTWLLLPPCFQQLDGETFSYQGGRILNDTTLSQRAWTLARTALEALPWTRGYVGIDLVLGDDRKGRDDRLIELNPRLTTSYIGLRHAVAENLTRYMIDDSVVPLRWSRRYGSVAFSAAGSVELASESQCPSWETRQLNVAGDRSPTRMVSEHQLHRELP